MHLADRLQQLEVLHIACADLHDIDILLKLINMGLVHQLADDGQAGQLARLDHVENPLGAKALKGVWAGTGLVSAAAQKVGAARLDSLRHRNGVRLALDAAGACHNGDGGTAADLDAVDIHHGIRRVEQAVCALVGCRHTGHILDPGVGQHILLGDFSRITDKAKDIVVGTADQRDRKALLLKIINDAVQLDLRRAPLGRNNHG